MPVPFQHHFNTRSARQIFALFAGPGIARPRNPGRVVAGDQGELGLGKIPVDDMEVRPADGAGEHSQEHLAGAGLRNRDLGFAQRAPGSLQKHRAHQFSHWLRPTRQ